MAEVIVDIPNESENWEPPVLCEKPEQEETHRAADVFFMQYTACILVLTALFLLRLCDQNAYGGVVDTFRAQTSEPDLPWVSQLIALVGELWK